MLAESNNAVPNNAAANNAEPSYKEKIRCGEVYRNLNGNQMFQKFYYRCLECSMDFESGPDFEEHVIVHLLQDDGENGENGESDNNVIDISSDNDEDVEDNAFLYAVEVTSMGGDEVSECDLPSPIKKMLSQESINLDDEDMSFSSDVDEDDDDSNDITFPCKGLRNQALHQYSEPDKCCQLCPAYFATLMELDQHRMIHAMPGTVECPHCYEVFSSAFKLHQHIRMRRKKAPILRKNGAKKKCHETNRDSKSQSETSINLDTDDDRKSGAKTKNTSSTSNDQNSYNSNQGNRQMQTTNNRSVTDGKNLAAIGGESSTKENNSTNPSMQSAVAQI